MRVWVHAQDTQNLLAVAESKTLEESKRRARAEIKAMAEENKRTELEEKLQEKQRSLDLLQAELASFRLAQLPAPTKALEEEVPADSIAQAEGPRDTLVIGDGQSGAQENLPSATSNQLEPGCSSDVHHLSSDSDVVAQCMGAFKGILQASQLGREAVPFQALSEFTAKLRSATPVESRLWVEVFQALQDGGCVVDVEELRKERDALKSTLKEMVTQVQDSSRRNAFLCAA